MKGQGDFEWNAVGTMLSKLDGMKKDISEKINHVGGFQYVSIINIQGDFIR